MLCMLATGETSEDKISDSLDISGILGSSPTTNYYDVGTLEQARYSRRTGLFCLPSIQAHAHCVNVYHYS